MAACCCYVVAAWRRRAEGRASQGPRTVICAGAAEEASGGVLLLRGGGVGASCGECASEGCGLQGRLVGARIGERGRSEAPSPAWGSPCVRVFRFVLFLTHRP